MNKKFFLCVFACLMCVLNASADPQKEVSVKRIRKEIMMKQAPWNKSSKVAICDFIKRIKSAYEKKDSNFLAQTFMLDKYYHNYKIEERDQYISQLKECFRSGTPVKLTIYDYDVSKVADNELYAIRLHHGYQCKSTTDTGYLFFIMDLNTPQQPDMKFWVWQSKPDPQLSNPTRESSPDDGLFNARMFM